MECPHCRDTLKAGSTSYTINRTGSHLIIDDVPAFICEQCQEPLFTEEAVRPVQQMIHELDARREKLSPITLAASAWPADWHYSGD